MDGEYLICKGDDCDAQIVGAISRWLTKVGILDWGNAVLEVLCEKGIVADAADLYLLTEAKLAAVEMAGRRVGGSATTMIKNLHAKTELPLATIVGSLGIPLCARSVCGTIVGAGFDTLQKLNDATVADLSGIIGPAKAREFVRGFQKRKSLIIKLLQNGVSIKAKGSGALAGCSVCFTGVRDKDLESVIEAQGGTIKSSVSRGLTYLVALDKNSGSGKATKALQYGTKVVDLDEMWTLAGGRP
jgi:DNA ligase (NAD+)